MTLNVGQLRELLNGVPDDVPVYLANQPEAALDPIYRAGAAHRVVAYGSKYEEYLGDVKPTETWVTPCFLLRLTP